MAFHFACSDRDGIRVSCDEREWYDHIVDEHPEVDGREEEIRLAISDPFAVYQDANHPDRKLYYRLTTQMPAPLMLGYIRVVVQYRKRSREVRGQVITAFLSPKIREGDTQLWSSSQQQT